MSKFDDKPVLEVLQFDKRLKRSCFVFSGVIFCSAFFIDTNLSLTLDLLLRGVLIIVSSLCLIEYGKILKHPLDILVTEEKLIFRFSGQTESYEWKDIKHFEERLDPAPKSFICHVVLIRCDDSFEYITRLGQFKKYSNKEVIEKLNSYLIGFYPDKVIPSLEELLQSPSGYYAGVNLGCGIYLSLFIILIIFLFLTLGFSIEFINNSSHSITDISLKTYRSQYEIYSDNLKREYDLLSLEPSEYSDTKVLNATPIGAIKVMYKIPPEVQKCYFLTYGDTITNKKSKCKFDGSHTFVIDDEGFKATSEHSCSVLYYDCSLTPQDDDPYEWTKKYKSFSSLD